MIGDNAVLLAVSAPGVPDGYNRIDTPGADLWTGRAFSYLRYHQRVSEGERATLQRTPTLFLRDAAGVPPVYSAGTPNEATTVLVEDRRSKASVKKRFRVVGITHSAAGTIADGTRLDLDDERVEA